MKKRSVDDAVGHLVRESLGHRARELRQAAEKCERAYSAGTPLGKAARKMARVYRMCATLLTRRIETILGGAPPIAEPMDDRIETIMAMPVTGRVQARWHDEERDHHGMFLAFDCGAWIPDLDPWLAVTIAERWNGGAADDG